MKEKKYVDTRSVGIYIKILIFYQEDNFKIEDEDVGPLYKLRIGHNDKGANSGWFLDKACIQRHALKGSTTTR